jgi:hypothetical protein
MNWNLFYLINREFVDMLLLGFFYLIIIGGAMLSFKLLLNSIKDDDGRD